MAMAKDGLTEEALFGAAVGEDARERAPTRLADALARQHPDAVTGADGHHIRQAQAVQSADKRAAVAVEAVGQDDLEAEAQREQLLNDLDGQLRFGLIDIASFE